MSIKIRCMMPRDYAAVTHLWRATPGMGLHAADDARAGILRFLRRNPRMSFVAFDGAQLVGAVLCGHDGRRGALHHLAVAQTRRKRGIGAELVARCLAVLARQKIQKCNIFVYRQNTSGQAFWLHTGWAARDDLRVLQKPAAARARPCRAC
jgi:ribosomal protein S18 acetylase RimI-like enzyme